MEKKRKVFKDSINLYRFIRLVLGTEVSDRQIARRWKMDEKNFHEFKTGKYPVPRLPKLVELAKVLGLSTHIICRVSNGAPAQKVHRLIKAGDSNELVKFLFNDIYEMFQSTSAHNKHHHDLFEKANDAIFVGDAKTGVIIDCNKEAEVLLGRSRKEIIGMHQSQLHPLQKKDYYEKHFKNHVKMGRIVETDRQQVARKDGTIVPVLISSRVMKINNRKVIQGIFRDISGQKGGK
ncbi:MAG: PAS domain-containing protein [Planctomycetes bacterium]|nr:PAS domain-containing protein [Planctomycetota bacterium]